MIALTLSAVGAGVAAAVGAVTITAALMPLALLFGGGAVLALGVFAALGFGLLVKTLTVAVSPISVLAQTQLSMGLTEITTACMLLHASRRTCAPDVQTPRV